MTTGNAGGASALLAAAAPAAAASDPAAAPAAPASGAPAAAPSSTPAPAAAPAAAPAPGTPPDYAWAGDDAAKAVAAKKGWASPADVIKSYGELEALLGGEKLPLPKTPDDKAGWDRVYAALGRPDSPEGYGIAVPDGVDPALSKEYASKAHELGLTTKQALELQKWHDEKGGALSTAAQAEIDARIDQEIAAVKDNWGQNFNQNAEIARRGSQALGLDGAALDAMEQHPAIGHKKLMDMLLKVGQSSGEANFHNPGGGSFNPVTKEAAQARLEEIKANPTERAEALKPGSAINKEVDRLDKIIAGVRPDTV